MRPFDREGRLAEPFATTRDLTIAAVAWDLLAGRQEEFALSVRNASRIGKSSARKSAAPAPYGGVDSHAYRAVMRHKAGAVSVVAAGAPGARAGLTATAVCSLSDDPPTVLVCVNRSAAAHDVICATGCFSVNLLADDQQRLAEVFCGDRVLTGEDRFEDADWRPVETGAPVLRHALAALDCDLADSHRFATHTIFLGHVRAARGRDEARPLLYFRGGYHGL